MRVSDFERLYDHHCRANRHLVSQQPVAELTPCDDGRPQGTRDGKDMFLLGAALRTAIKALYPVMRVADLEEVLSRWSRSPSRDRGCARLTAGC